MGSRIGKFFRIASFFLVSVWNTHAAPGTASDTPLVVTGAAQPNIMLLIDNSGSMAHIVPSSATFNSSTIYAACSNATYQIASGAEVELRIIATSGKTYFRRITGTATDYDWGTGSGNGLTGKNKRCFIPTATYLADLNADNGTKTAPSSNHGNATEYSGNFLNWYFSNAGNTTGDTFSVGATYKSGTLPRYQIANDSGKSLIDNLNGVYLGLAKYQNPSNATTGAGGGANILYNISDLTAANKTGMKAQLDAIAATYTASGGNSTSTPLASAFKEIGRYYFMGNDASGTKQTLHPGNSYGAVADSSKDGRDIFNSTPSGLAPASAPIQYSCQKNFLITVTDGQPNGDGDVPAVLQDYDQDCVAGSPTYTSACISPFNKDKKNNETYEANGTDYMNDVAAAMYDMDLRPDLTGKQNVATYLIGFADPNLQDSNLLKTTASRGGGLFLTAGDSTALDAALASATQSIIAQSAATASVAFNSSTLSTDSAVFFAKFNSAKWSGELHAIPLSDTGSLDSEDWEASAKLDSDTVLTPANRVIITSDGADGVPFQWSSAGIDKTSPTEPMLRKDLKNDNSANFAADANGSQRLDYLRGVRTNEATGSSPLFRSRASRLGDIVDSTPVYVGAPQSSWPEYAANNFFGSSTSSYSAFRAAQAARTPVVYVGANDGMLHGFNAQFGAANADRGKELLGYVPAAVASDLKDAGLHYLTTPAYAHKFSVDLTPTIADVFVSPDNDSTHRDWRTVLVGGLRQGGKGYFALDITTPGNFTEANAASLLLWEFTDANDSDLGFSYSEPTIAMMNNGKWAVIFGNGYNSVNGIAKLFILYLEQGADGAWAAGDYVKIDTKVGGPLAANGNGLSSPQAADIDANGTVDRVYAGDLKGNMWVFDVSSATDTNWRVGYGTIATPAPLFSAAATQPITARPLLARNIDRVGGVSPNIVVMFGTGQYLTSLDLTSTAQQAFYVVGDSGTGSLVKANLIQRTFTTTGVLRAPSTGQAALDWSAKSGWYVNLVAGTTAPVLAAERVFAQAALRRRTLFFNTDIPDSSPCAGGGSGWLMSFDFLTGLNPAQGTFDSNSDGIINSTDLLYVGQFVSGGLLAKSGFLGDKQYTPTSSGTLGLREINVGSSALEGRLGWEELRAK